MNQKEQQTIFIDCGGLKCTVYWEDTGEFEELQPQDALTIQDRLNAGDTLIGEKSHFGDPKRGMSRAQYFEAEELLEWYQSCRDKGIELGFFSSIMTEKARRIFGIQPKTDKNDLRAISKYLKKFPQYQIMKPRTTLETHPLVEEGWEVKEEIKDMLNLSRDRKYVDPDDKASQLLTEALPEITQRVKSNTKDAFGLKVKKNGNMMKSDLKFCQLYTIWSTLIDFDGTIRLREPTGRPAGWKYVKKHIFRFSPHHGNGGTARSNLYWHGMPKYIAKKQGNKLPNKKGHLTVLKKFENFTDQEWESFRKYRKEYRDAVRDMFQVMRKMVVGI